MSNLRLVVVAAVLGVVVALFQVIRAAQDDRSTGYVVGVAFGTLFLPGLAALVFRRQGTRAAMVAFIVVALLTFAGQAVGAVNARAEERDQDRARGLLAPLGQSSLSAASGECLVRRVADFDESVLVKLERTEEEPGVEVADQLRDAFVECGVQGWIADGIVAGLEAGGIGESAFDRRCMMIAISDPGVVLMYTTGNTEMVARQSESAPVSDAVYVEPWAHCVDGGRLVRDVVRAAGGPTVTFDAASCLSDWLDSEDLQVQLLTGDLIGLPDAVGRCLSDEELDAWDRWAATS